MLYASQSKTWLLLRCCLSSAGVRQAGLNLALHLTAPAVSFSVALATAWLKLLQPSQPPQHTRQQAAPVPELLTDPWDEDESTPSAANPSTADDELRNDDKRNAKTSYGHVNDHKNEHAAPGSLPLPSAGHALSSLFSAAKSSPQQAAEAIWKQTWQQLEQLPAAPSQTRRAASLAASPQLQAASTHHMALQGIQAAARQQLVTLALVALEEALTNLPEQTSRSAVPSSHLLVLIVQSNSSCSSRHSLHLQRY